MNYLNKSLCYLAGAMDDPKLKDQGKGWRKDFVRISKEKGLNIIYLDPTKKLSNLTGEVDDDHKILIKLQKQHRYQELRQQMKKIVRSDLRLIDIVDSIVVMIDTDVHQCGSYHQMINAVNQHKPVFVIAKNGVDKLPRWIFSLVHYDLLFNSVEQTVDYLAKLNSGQIKLNDKWVLIRKELHDISSAEIV